MSPCPNQDQANKALDLKGHVFRSGTYPGPITGAELTITGSEPHNKDVRATTKTGKDGGYEFKRLPPGIYHIASSGFVTLCGLVLILAGTLAIMGRADYKAYRRADKRSAPIDD